MKTINLKKLSLNKSWVLTLAMFLSLHFNARAAVYYWVGNSGNWDDFANHWATTSGGSVFHTQPPTQNDDVNFDFNSFTAPNCSIAFTNPAACLNFYGFPNFNPSMPLAGGPIPSLTVFGSFICPTPFDIQFPINFFNMSPGTFDIQTGINQFAIQIYNPNGPSTYNLLSDFKGCLSVVSAKLNTNNYNIDLSCNGFYIAQNAEVNFGTSTVTNSGLSAPELLGLNIDNTSIVNTSQATINVTGDFIHASGGTSLNIKSLTAGNIKCVGDSISTAIVTRDYFNGGQNVINNLSFSNTNYPVLTDSLTTTSDNTIDTLQFAGNGVIDPFSGNRNYVNNIITSLGSEVKFGSGDTTYISTFSDYSNPITLSSTQTGQPSFLKFNGGQCFNAASLQDINASGTGSFYAGSAGVDLGGNTGWQFAPCSIVSNVWPGDANYDLTTNNLDVLNIGLIYGNTGPVRTGASLAYVAQPATDWNGYFQTAVNHKHADTNGDGLVNDDDTTAIALNYGLTHPARIGAPSSTSLTGLPLYINLNPDSASLSDTIQIEVALGSTQMPVDSIYGIAFTINFDTTYVDTAYIASNYSQSWMGTAGVDLLCYDKKFPVEGRIEAAITRTDQNNVSGSGGIAKFTVVIVDNVSGRIGVPFTLSNAYAITKDEYELSLSLNADTLQLDTTALGINNVSDLMKVTVYPNPARGNLQISSSEHRLQWLTIETLFGENIMTRPLDNKSHVTVPINELKQGSYILNIVTNKGIIRKKMIKL